MVRVTAIIVLAFMSATVPADQQPASQSAAATQLAQSSRPWRPVDRAVIVPIRDEITEITLDSVERRLERIRQNGIRLVIFEFDTPGGALQPTLEICHAIKSLRGDGVRTYAWINNEAYSAGTIIALATDGIVMTANATMGDCQPIMITPGGATAVPQEIEAKATSPLLAELRDSARRNGYDIDLIYAFIRPEMQIFWMVNTETGEKRFVEASERDELFGLETPDEPTNASEKDDEKPSRKPSRHGSVPDSRSKTAWKYVKSAPGLETVPQPVDTDRELLTMRTVEATAYGFCLATLNSDDDLRDHLQIGSIERMENTWMEEFVEWLASPMVRGVLFLLMMLGAYTEFQAPGFGLPGGIALVALALFFGAPYMAGFTVTWEIIVVLLGLVLLAVELFIFPGFGLPGIIGLILVVAGTMASFVPQEPGFGEGPHWPTMQISYDYMIGGLWAMAGGMGGALIGMIFVAKYLPKVPMAGRLIAPNPVRAQVLPDEPYHGAVHIGDRGRTEGPLRPAGKARFGDLLVDVVTEGDYIDRGTNVQVVQREGARVVVRRAD